MHIDFGAPVQSKNINIVKLTPERQMIDRLSLLGATVERDEPVCRIVTKNVTYTLRHNNGGIRMELSSMLAALTQDDVDCICREVRHGILGPKWTRIYEFGPNINTTQISDDDIVHLSRRVASWCHIRGGAYHIRATCPNCGIRNVHPMPLTTTHLLCGPKRIKERGTVKFLQYDCPGYTINPRIPRGLFMHAVESLLDWQ